MVFQQNRLLRCDPNALIQLLERRCFQRPTLSQNRQDACSTIAREPSSFLLPPGPTDQARTVRDDRLGDGQVANDISGPLRESADR
jgi:hypothetical protein